jgi:hypothetical protein
MELKVGVISMGIIGFQAINGYYWSKLQYHQTIAVDAITILYCE